MTDTEDWRRSVSQSKRSEQIRYISEILSTAEPGSTPAQKLMLSMRFEDDTFQKAKSYEDYQKKLVKKLQKVQRKYKPPPKSKDNVGKSLETLKREQDEAIEKELREKYGGKMKYIIENAEKATYALKMKLQHANSNGSNNNSVGSRDADILKKHADTIGQWAIDIGVLPLSYKFSNGLKYKNKKRDLKMIKQHLGERVENIRQHIVKHADVNLYLEEEWIKLEKDMDKLMAKLLSRIHQRLIGVQITDIKNLIERASVRVPAPRRGRPEDVKEAVILHIDKIRAASNILMNYIVMEDKSNVEMKNILKRMHTTAVDGLSFITANCKKETGTIKKEIKLEDAWSRTIKYENPYENSEFEMCSRPSKRIKIRKQNIIVRTRVLLQPGQRTPSYILQALKDKNVQIIRNSKIGGGARIRMIFGTAFEMNIFFSPLLVTFRALPPLSANATEKVEDDDCLDKRFIEETEFRQMIVDGGLPTWKSSHSALDTLQATAAKKLESKPYVMYDISDSIAESLIAKKLEHVSFRTTHILRRCFADMTETTRTSNDNGNIEVSETSALMKFIQLARKTYLEVESN